MPTDTEREPFVDAIATGAVINLVPNIGVQCG